MTRTHANLILESIIIIFEIFWADVGTVGVQCALEYFILPTHVYPTANAIHHIE